MCTTFSQVLQGHKPLHFTWSASQQQQCGQRRIRRQKGTLYDATSIPGTPNGRDAMRGLVTDQPASLEMCTLWWYECGTEAVAKQDTCKVDDNKVGTK